MVSRLNDFAGIPGSETTIPSSTFHLGSIGTGCSDTIVLIKSCDSSEDKRTTTFEDLLAKRLFAHLNGSVIKLPSPTCRISSAEARGSSVIPTAPAVVLTSPSGVLIITGVEEYVDEMF